MEANRYFKQAVPIWEEGREKERNLTLGFTGSFDKTAEGQAAEIYIAASSVYRVFLNGTLLGCGPARAAHGYYRVDRYVVPAGEQKEKNVLAVEVVGFNVNSYSNLDVPSFLQAEVRSGSAVLLYTGSAPENEGESSCSGGTAQSGAETAGRRMTARVIADRVQKVQRYSFQRPFIEAVRLSPDYAEWRTEEGAEDAVRLAVCSEKKLLERHVEYPRLTVTKAVKLTACGTFQAGLTDNEIWKDRATYQISEKLKGYPVEELELPVSNMMDQTRTLTLKEWESCASAYVPEGQGECADKKTSVVSGGDEAEAALTAGQFRIYDMGLNLTGMIRLGVSCQKDSILILAFDEVLTDRDVNYKRMSCVNALYYELKAGSYLIETIQPYTCRYIKPMVFEGVVSIGEISVREYKNPEAGNASFSCSDPEIGEIFEAGRETFAQNALDIYMDCPSRERAGWLCDSYFTSRVEADLTGGTKIEDNFLENYALPERFEFLPDGMIAMCYPSDHNDGVFIPNWAMWFILELEEYAKRNPSQELTGSLYSRVEGILNYLKPFENEYGLLEDLKSWVFIEWSRANDLTAGVNYPSNMLYAGTLDAAGRLYGKEEWINKAEAIRETIRRQSFNGRFFRDQSLRENGKLVPVEETTEVCQYYAFYFGTADAARYPELFETLMTGFGPKRDPETEYPDVPPANAFIGNYLRVEILSEYGRSSQLLAETKGFFKYMADRTGTLWENTGAYASCDHGFASHIIHCYYRDLLGVKVIDRSGRRIVTTAPDCGLEWCEGRIPVGDGCLEYGWRREADGTVRKEYKLPDGYTLEER